MDKVLLHNVLSVFLVKETTPGVAKAPLTADSVVVRADGIKFPSQPVDYSKGREALNTRSVTALLRNLRNAGSVTIPTYFRPSGVAGTPPAERPLLCALFGKETITPGSKVEYQPSATKDAYTLWIKTANGILFAACTAVHGVKGSEGEDGIIQLDWDASFQRLGWAGETTLKTALDGGETVVEVNSAAEFSVGARIKVGSSDGLMVTAIDYENDTLTVDPAVTGAQAENVTVAGSLPASQAVGDVLAARPAVKVDGVAMKWKGIEFSVTEEVKFIKEVSEDPAEADYPGEFIPGPRDVSATVRAVARTSDLKRLRAVDADRALSFDWSAQAAGSRVKIDFPQGRTRVPEFEAGDPSVEFSMGFDARASSALEDESEWTYE